MRFDAFPEFLDRPYDPAELYEMFGVNWGYAKKISDRIYLKCRLSESQNHRCAYCGRLTNNIRDHKQQATVEHVIPRSRGGTDDWYNLVMVCSRCNNLRGNNPLEAEAIVKQYLKAA